MNNLKLENINPVLINLTGVRLIAIFLLLLKAPQTAEEIYDYLRANNYPNDSISPDTLRNDMNSLRFAGCEITRADKSNDFKYKLISHPFDLNLNLELTQKLKEIYIKSCSKFGVYHLLIMEKLFIKLAQYTNDSDIAENLLGISIIKDVDKTVLKELYKAYTSECDVTFQYKGSLQPEDIKFNIKKFVIRSNKLYIEGFSYKHNADSFLPVTKIFYPINFHINKISTKNEPQKVQFELKNCAMLDYTEDEFSKIINKTSNTIIVEKEFTNEFKIIQEILSYGPNCTVISNEKIRQKVINILKEMQKVYSDDNQ